MPFILILAVCLNSVFSENTVSFLAVTWIEGIKDSCGFHTLTNAIDPELVLTASSADTLKLQKNVKRWKFSDDGILINQENVWKSQDKWEIISEGDQIEK